MKTEKRCSLCGVVLDPGNTSDVKFTVCVKCFDRLSRKPDTDEEKEKLKDEMREYRKERTKYLRSIPPEDFIKIVMGDD